MDAEGQHHYNIFTDSVAYEIICNPVGMFKYSKTQVSSLGAHREGSPPPHSFQIFQSVHSAVSRSSSNVGPVLFLALPACRKMQGQLCLPVFINTVRYSEVTKIKLSSPSCIAAYTVILPFTCLSKSIPHSYLYTHTTFLLSFHNLRNPK